MRFPWSRRASASGTGESGGSAGGIAADGALRFGVSARPNLEAVGRGIALRDIAYTLDELDRTRLREICAAGGRLFSTAGSKPDGDAHERGAGEGDAGSRARGSRVGGLTSDDAGVSGGVAGASAAAGPLARPAVARSCEWPALADALAVPESAVVLVAPASCGRRALAEMGPATRGRLFTADLTTGDIGAGADALRARIEAAATAALAYMARAEKGQSVAGAFGPMGSAAPNPAGGAADAAGTGLAASPTSTGPRVLFVCGTRAGAALTDVDAPEAMLRAACDHLAAAHARTVFLPLVLDGPADSSLLYPALAPALSAGAAEIGLASLGPCAQVQLAIASLLDTGESARPDCYSVNLIGAGAPLDPACELYGFLACATLMRVRQASAASTLDSLRGMRVAGKNILLDPRGAVACRWMESALGTPFHLVRRSLITRRITHEYKTLAHFLGATFDYEEARAASLEALESARDWLADLRVAVGPNAAGDPFETTFLLADLGARVSLIVADTVSEQDEPIVEALRSRNGSALVVPSVCAAMATPQGAGADVGAVDVAIGLDAGRLCPEAAVVLPQDGYLTLGYQAPVTLLREIRAALDAPRTVAELLDEGPRRRSPSREEFRRVAGATMNGALARASEKKAEAEAAAERERAIR